MKFDVFSFVAGYFFGAVLPFVSMLFFRWLFIREIKGGKHNEVLQNL